MNLVEQWFPKKTTDEDTLVDNICLVMHFFGISKKEFDELYISQYIILRDFALNYIKEENNRWNKIFSVPRGKRIGK